LHNFYRRFHKEHFVYKLNLHWRFCDGRFTHGRNLSPWFRTARSTGPLIQPLAEFCHKRVAGVFHLQRGHGLPGLIGKTVFKVELNFDPAIFKIRKHRFFHGSRRRFSGLGGCFGSGRLLLQHRRRS
jgi:hypothetical protein